MTMRDITSITITIIPAHVRTKDDPLGQRGYFAWKCLVAGDVQPTEQFGRAQRLDESPSSERLEALVGEMLRDIDRIRRMTPKQMAAGKAAAAQIAIDAAGT